MSPAHTIEYARHDVTAVLVTHDGERWVGRVFDALESLDRPVQRVVAVDTGSRDATVEILRERLGEGRVLTRPRDAGFGQAVAFGVGAVYGVEPAPQVTGHPDEPVDWVWILHDDSEPATDSLHYLLALADSDPQVAVVGPKVLGWYNSRELLEVGLTIGPNGRRETGLDRGEEDQGQRDGRRAVLAVGSAGMLVRRDVWDALGGFDRNLSFMRDDIDFCWRVNAAGWRVVVNTDAVVYHAEAASHGRRRIARVGRTHYLDRANALYVLLANMRLAKLPLAMLRLSLGSLARAFGYLVAKLPDYAIDEALAFGSVVGRFPSLIRGRWRRRRTRAVKLGDLRPLMPPRWTQFRHMIEAIAERLPDGTVSADTGRHRAVTESGPVSDDAEDLEGSDVPIVRRIAAHPLVVLIVTLAVITLLAARELIGDGRLMGGALLPAPRSASELWDVYLASWHPVGIGSDASATPYIGVIAGLGTLLFGNASYAVDLLLIGAVPLSGLAAYFAVRKVVASRLLRLWAAGAYALLPAVTGAVAAGRVGTAVGAILLPIAALGVIRTLGLDGKPGTWRAAWTTGLLLAVIAAFVPVAWLLALVLAVVAVATGRTIRATDVLRLAAVLVTPVGVLLPWSIDLIRRPSLLFLEAGLPGPDLSEPNVGAVDLLLLHPGGPGMYPAWISAGILAAGFAALMRRERRSLVLGGWAVALVGLVVGLFMSRVEVIGPTLATAVPAWPGFPTVLMGAGLLLAALIGAEGARERIARTAFGWKQPVSIGVSLLAVVAPVMAALWWVASGADGPVERRDPVVLPAFVAAEGESTDRPRTLVLQLRKPGELSYALVRDVGPRLGNAETAPRTGEQGGLDQVVREVVSGRGAGQVDELADYAIRYVLLTAPLNEDLVQALDAVPGLTRVSITEDTGLWRLNVDSARVRILPPPAEGDSETATDELKSAEAEPLPSAEVGVAASIPPGPAGRTLVLAESADAGWQAVIDGTPLRPTMYDGWAQAFALPESGGFLQLSHDSPARTRWLIAQVLAIAIVFVLAMPSGRRPGEAPDIEEGVEVERHHRARSAPFAVAADAAPLDQAALSNVGTQAANLPGPYGEAPHEAYEPVEALGDPAPYPPGMADPAVPPPGEWAAPTDYQSVPHGYSEHWRDPDYSPRYYETEPVVPHQVGPDTLAGSYEVVNDERYPAYEQADSYEPDDEYGNEARRRRVETEPSHPAGPDYGVPDPAAGYRAPDYLTPDPASDYGPADHLGADYTSYGPPDYVVPESGSDYQLPPGGFDPLDYGPPLESDVDEEEQPWHRDPHGKSRIDADPYRDNPGEREHPEPRGRHGRHGRRR